MEFAALSSRGTRSATLCGRDAVQVIPEGRAAIDLKELAARLASSLPVQASEFMLRFSAEGLQVSVFADGRAIIGGTKDPAVARGVYSRYVGG
jgi:adenylyltransferase/sulfurtransferase